MSSGPVRTHKVPGPFAWALGLCGVAIAVTAYRGTQASAGEVIPARGEGVRCQIVARGERRPVECAIALERPIDVVWQQITDFGELGAQVDSWLFAYRIEGVEGMPGGTRLRGHVETWLHAFPVDVTIRRSEPGAERRAYWDSAGTAFTTNRGGWTVSRVDDRTTLVRYSLELDVPAAPGFLVRALLLDHLGAAIHSIVQAPRDG